MNNKTLIIIPAKSLSTRIKDKNFKLLGKKSLLEIKIKNCLKSKIGKVFVSTDSKKIAKLSKKFGACVPFLRPKKYSNSKSSMMSCVLHTLRKIKKEKYFQPKYVALLPITYPFISFKEIKKAFSCLKKNKNIDSVCSYTKSANHPYEFIDLNKNMIHFNLIKFKKKYFSDFERTQDYPDSYVLSGAIRISKTRYFEKFLSNTSHIFNNNVINLKSCIGYEISKRSAFDINYNEDLKLAKLLHKNKTI